MRQTSRDQIKSMFVQKQIGHIAGSVLDVGSGKMPYRRLYWASDIDGFRPDRDVTEWTAFDIRAVGDVQGDVQAMPFEDESFDTVLCIDVLQEVPDPLAAMKEMYRVLKTGGKFIVCALNTWNDNSEAMWGIRTTGMRYLLDNAGFNLGTSVVEAKGSLFSSSMHDYRYQHKYGVAVPEGVIGLMDVLDDVYPLMTMAVTNKEKTDGDEDTTECAT